ncbi:MAG: Crp/Fnr family transcriptional regulator [Bacteroidales bacterium]|nr:Crp/Fnr family transcriptional regulator [Bacteroidales bacterium]
MGKKIKQSILSNIYNYISSIIEIDDNEWSYYSAMFEIKEIKKKDILLMPDSICKNVYFVNHGLLRIFFLDRNGNEITFYFALENDLATDLESFLLETPSHYCIQALEDTQVVVWSRYMIQDGYYHLRYGDRLARIILEKYFVLFSRKLQSLYTKNPLERYNDMIKRYPTIMQRIPQHYIASYLNITSVHLSRLKRLNKKINKC